MSHVIGDTHSDSAGADALMAAVRAVLQPGSSTQVAVSARRHQFTVDEPLAWDGTDLGATPVEHLLAALASCTVITYRYWARQLDLEIESIAVDVRGSFATAEGARPGFVGVELVASVTGPESATTYRRLEAVVAAHCPVADNLTNGVPLTTRLELPAA